MKKYRKIIRCFLDINPSPSDAQFHALAQALGVDQEQLEAVAYKMLAEHENQEGSAIGLLAEVADLSHTDRALSGMGDEDYMPYYDAAVLDGSRDATSSELIQDSTSSDGGFDPFDQDALKNDGPVVPNLRKLVSRFSTMSGSAPVLANMQVRKPALQKIQKALSKIDMSFTLDSEGTHLHYEIDSAQDAQDALDELQKSGYKFRVEPGVLQKRNFAVKAGSLVLQRTGSHLRIFFSA